MSTPAFNAADKKRLQETITHLSPDRTRGVVKIFSAAIGQRGAIAMDVEMLNAETLQRLQQYIDTGNESLLQNIPKQDLASSSTRELQQHEEQVKTDAAQTGTQAAKSSPRRQAATTPAIITARSTTTLHTNASNSNSNSNTAAAPPAVRSKDASLAELSELFGSVISAVHIKRTYNNLNQDFQKTLDALCAETGLHKEMSSSTAQSSSDELKSDSGNSSGYSYREVSGDLFTAPATAALAHCISTDCAMGKGIAVLFKQKFGGVAELKAQNCRVGETGVLKREGRFVYYLMSKERYFHKPTYADLESCLIAMRSHASHNGVTALAMPRIGSGLDGLLWQNVRATIQRVFEKSEMAITVYVK